MLRRRGFCRSAAAAALAFVVFLFLLSDREALAAAGFSDVQGHWAEQNIVEMSAYGIVHGYPGGLFKPNEDIQFQQAIVMIINALGWGEEAAGADLTGLSFPAGTWAKEYLALAVKKGMLTKEGLPWLNPKRPATRLEVASLLCLALNFDPDYTPLNFRDAEKINKDYRGYVGAIVKRGIMIGLPGNVFAPEMNITRAQMCTMLARLIEQNWIAPPPPRKRLVGRITGVGEDKNTLTVRNLDGETTVVLSGDCPLFEGKKMVARSALLKNRRVKFIVDHEQKAYYGSLLGDFEPAQRSVEGFLVSLAKGAKGYSLVLETEEKEQLQFDVWDDALLLEEGREITAPELKRDSFVRIDLDQHSKVFTAEVFQPETVRGTLIELDGAEMIIKSRGVRRDYEISKNVQVTRNTVRQMDLADLEPGDYVSAVVLNNKVFQIDCLSDVVTGFSGMVSKVRGKSIYIYVQNEEKRYDLDEKVEIFQDGRRKDLADLKRGDYINFQVADNKVISIELIDEEEGEFTGTVLTSARRTAPSSRCAPQKAWSLITTSPKTRLSSGTATR